MRQAEDLRCENREAGKAKEGGEAETGAGSGAEPTGSAGTAMAGPGKADPGYASRYRPDRPQGRQQGQTEGGEGEEQENPRAWNHGEPVRKLNGATMT